MTLLKSDLRAALRSLAKSPVFTGVAAISLALGIGANAAVFSLLDQVLVRSLPVPNPSALISLRSPGYRTGHIHSDGDGDTSFSYPMYQDLRAAAPDVVRLVGRLAVNLSVAVGGDSETAAGELVSGSYFDVLGVEPALGRLLGDDDARAPGGEPTAVISYEYWTRRFARDPSVINRPLAVNGHPLTIVGVAPAPFYGVQLGQAPDIFVPITMKAQMTPNWDGLADRKDYWVNVLGRLAPGASIAQARAALESRYRTALEAEATQLGFADDRRARFVAKPLLVDRAVNGRDVLQQGASRPLVALMAMTALVLLIACANVAGLLIARGSARDKEIAVRLALGAGRWRIVRLLLTESLVLSILGGGLGLAVAAWTTDALVHMIPASAGIRGLSGALDARVLTFATLVTLLTTVLFGLVPALRASSPSVVPALKEQAGASTGGASHARLRRVLVTGQIALTLLLVLAGGLFAASVYRLHTADTGVRSDRVLAFSTAPELNGYTPARARVFVSQVIERLAAAPGVESVASATVPIFTDSTSGGDVTIEGRAPSDGDDNHVYRNWVTPRFFTTMGMMLARGRDFTDADIGSNATVVVVNETMAGRFFGSADPVGRSIGMLQRAGERPMTHTIVGVVRDSKHANLREEVHPMVYFPITHHPALGRATFYVRTTATPATIAEAARQAVHRVDPTMPVFRLGTLDAVIDESILTERLVAVLSACFAALAAMLAGLGVYGVTAYSVARRTREIGVRIALGARPGDVALLLGREVGWMAITGSALGAAAAYPLGRLIESLLYGVSPHDPALMIAAATTITLLALAAGFLPAQRAARLDPTKALRLE